MQVYLNYAAKANAGLWPEKNDRNDLLEPSEDTKSQVGAEAPVGGTSEAEHLHHLSAEQSLNKKQKTDPPVELVEVDIDWDRPTIAHSDASPRSPDGKLLVCLLLSLLNRVYWDSIDTRLWGEQYSCFVESMSHDLAFEHSGYTQEGISATRHNLGRKRRNAAVPAFAAASAEGLEEYSPSRHGGESPPRGPPAPIRQTVSEVSIDSDACISPQHCV